MNCSRFFKTFLCMILVSSGSYIVFAVNDLQCFFNSATTCPGGTTKILGIQNDTGGTENAHAENRTYAAYANSLCCNNSNPSIIITPNCGVTIVKLSAEYNAHLLTGNNTDANYPVNVCMNSSSRNLTCSYPTSSCTVSQACLFSLASSEGANDTNAHMSNCSSYPQKVCCGYSNSPPVMNTSRINPTPTASDGVNLTGYCNATDVDWDNLFYNYKWYKNGVVYYQNVAFKNGSISAGGFHTCGIRANDSRVLCWGYNNKGQLGTGDYVQYNSSTLINDSSPYLKISAGDSHTCGIRASDSRVLCWGTNDNGELGNGDTAISNPNPTLISDTSPYLDISAGYYHTCGIRANDSRVLCWGAGGGGQLGTGDATAKNYNPRLTTDTMAYFAITTGGAHTCGIRANDSRVLCTGNNQFGQCGTGNTTRYYSPFLMNDTNPYVKIEAGDYYTCGIRANDSRVLCWGDNQYGQLGTNDTVQYNNTMLINDTSPYLEISAGTGHTCGIRANDSRVLCWGFGNSGRLGTGGTSNYYYPVLINDTNIYVKISNGGVHTCGIRANDSQVLCWGYNAYGEVGTNLTVQSYNISTLILDSSSYAGRFNQSQEMNVYFYVHNAYTSIGQNWTLSCQAMDYTSYSSWMNSTNTTIINTYPTKPILIYPANGNISVFERYVNFTWTASFDQESDQINYSLNVTCGQSCPAYCAPVLQNLSNTNYTNLNSLCFGISYNWSVNACDSFGQCNISDTSNFTIASQAGLIFIVNQSNLGTLSTGQNINTLQNTTSPLVLRNTGNVILNVTVNASTMFSSVGMNTQYYQFRASQNESNSFNEALSQVTYTNMAITMKNLLYNMSYVDTNDEARLDFNITVPVSEPPGSKTSSILVEGLSPEE